MPSFVSTAEAWWSTPASDSPRTRGGLGVGQAVGYQGEDLPPATGRPGRVGARRGLGAARHLQDTAVRSRRRVSAATGAAPSPSSTATPPARLRLAQLDQLQRPLVRCPDRRPGVGGRAPVAAQPRRVLGGQPGNGPTGRPAGAATASAHRAPARGRGLQSGAGAAGRRPEPASPVSQPRSASATAVGTSACRLCACSALSRAAARASRRGATLPNRQHGQRGKGLSAEHPARVGASAITRRSPSSAADHSPRTAWSRSFQLTERGRRRSCGHRTDRLDHPRSCTTASSWRSAPDVCWCATPPHCPRRTPVVTPTTWTARPVVSSPRR